MTLVAFDFETHPIGPGSIFPKPVCLSLAWEEDAAIRTALIGSGDDLEGAVEALLLDEDVELIAHHAPFDLGVIATAWPDLGPALAAKLEAGRVHCTKIREKLLCLSTHGRLESIELPDGSKLQLKFSLADLSKKYLGKDRTDQKTADDSWRLRYNELDGKKASEYPTAAALYPVEDATDCLAIYRAQEAACENETGPASITNEWLHVAAAFALQRMTARGMVVDQTVVDQLAMEVLAELTPEKMAPLYAAGILRPAEPPRPYVRQPSKLTPGKEESVDTKALGAHVEAVYRRLGRKPKYTPTKRISTDDEVLADLKDHDPVLAVYAARQEQQKLVTTDLPRIRAPLVHPEYDAIKETLRTSSYAGKLFPSLNIQNVDPRVRRAFKPREGHYFLSKDYSGIELGALAQKVYELFGHSTLRDQINGGIDPHVFLGAQAAAMFDQNFAAAVAHNGDLSDRTLVYEAFSKLKKSTDPASRDFFKHYRKLAKPTGLGYPGGLGAETFVSYAKATFGVIVTVEEATVLRDQVWHPSYPEMRDYFQWINQQCHDPRNPTIRTKVDGQVREVDGFAYLSALGTHRAGCTFCAAANGAGLQTRIAEGAKIALANLEFEMLRGTLLALPLCFIHDEIIFEVREDLVAEADAQLDRIMVDSMRIVLPDVVVRCQGTLMRRWYKEAEPVFVNGKLVPWEPEEKHAQVAAA